MPVSAREFTVAGEYVYDRRSPVRWIISHVLRYPWLPAFTLLGNICSSVLYNGGSILIGRAFDLVATPGALAALEKSGQNAMQFLSRHVTGDWGEIPEEDKKENQFSLEKGFRLMSGYRTTAGDRVWVITEGTRSHTTLLLPDEY